MKRAGNLWGQITSFENLYDAFLDARRGKQYRDEVLAFDWALGENLLELQRELRTHTYRVGPYRAFMVTEPKRRIVMALGFRDRVVQWAIYRVINPLLDKQFIADTFACRENKGSHEAVARLQSWLRHAHRTGAKWYCLKIDITKFFYRIDHQVLIRLLDHEFKDPDLRWLLWQIIDSPEPFGMALDSDLAQGEQARIHGLGMPIGNLTSQMFANLYLNPVDHYVKEELRERYYIRYMDDMLILAPSKTHLHKVRALIETYLSDNLNLVVNNKTSVRPVNDGIEFLGYRVWATHRKLRRSTMRRMTRKMNHLGDLLNTRRITYEKARPVIASYLGMARHFNSYHYLLRLAERFPGNH